MEIDYLDLEKLIGIVDYAVENGKPEHIEFYQTVRRAFSVYAMMAPLLNFAKRSTISIPFQLAMDLNSIVLTFGRLPKDILKSSKPKNSI